MKINGLPTIRTYGDYSSDNYGAHALQVSIGPLTVWFSYRTPIAFQVDGHRRVVRKNDWSVVTGKHLRWIDGFLSKDRNSGRVDGETFERLWKEQVASLFEPELVPAGGGDESIFEGLGNLLGD